MYQLILSGIECYAHHGCLPQETAIGSRYCVDITFYADLSNAANSDNLTQTIDYVEVNEICSKIKVAITKYNPPVQGFIREAIFVIEI